MQFLEFRKPWPRFILCAMLLIAASLPQLLPRISRTPWPESEARLHHHMGDGSTEIGVLAAHENWRRRGYAEMHFLPCLTNPKLTLGPEKCPPYTHYPPGSYLMSSVLLKTFGWDEAPESALKRTRAAIFFLTALISAWALYLFGNAFRWGGLPLASAALALGGSYGWIVFSDNLFALGLVLALAGLLIAVAVATALKRRATFYFTVAALTSAFSVELIPATFLAPLLLYRRDTRDARRLWIAAAGAFALVVGLRLLQNALDAGGVGIALQDWLTIARYRITGAAPPSTHAAAATADLSGVFWSDYILTWLRYQRIMITKYGQVWLALAAAWLAYRRQFRELALLGGIFLIALSWNFTFLQHSYIHLYTVRYVVWPFAISIALVWPRRFNY